MKRPRKKNNKPPVSTGRADRHSRHDDDLARVMRELESVGMTHRDLDPLVEQLRKCPETFAAGEMLGKMFDSLKHKGASSEDDERLIPPAGAVFPLV